MRLAFLDLETSGGLAARDRIIEIGVVVVEDGVEQQRWQQLVNPGERLSPFIIRYTGIDDAMLAEAPPFAEVAATLRQLLEGCVLVAHNARFDYAFLKSEYRRLGERFVMPSLCTVKLSRSLFPDERHHNLDAVISRHQLPLVTRHRALGDAEALVTFIAHLRASLPAATLDAAMARAMNKPVLPAQLAPDTLDEIPTSPGVYRFYGASNELLYVGKSINLHERVLSHFQGYHQSNRGQQMTDQIHRIDWTCCAGEFSALLLELKQIKQLQPIFNRRSRAAKTLATLALVAGSDGYLRLKVSNRFELSALGQCYGVFRSSRQAQQAVAGLVAKHQLCDRLCGLDKGKGPCFGQQLGRCRGACTGSEPAERYNARLQLALASMKLRQWPWPGPIVVSEHDQFTGLTEHHLIDQWCHLDSSRDDYPEWHSRRPPRAFDLDTYRLISDFLLKHHRLQVRALPPIPAADEGV